MLSLPNLFPPLPNLFPRPLNPDVNPITACFVTTTCKPGLLQSRHLCVHPGFRKGNASQRGGAHKMFLRRGEGFGLPVALDFGWLAACRRLHMQQLCAWRGARGLLLVRTVRDGVSTSPCADYLPGGTRAHAKGSQPRLAAARANRAPSARRRLARVPTTARGWAQRMGNQPGAGGKRGEILPAATSPEAHPSSSMRASPRCASGEKSIARRDKAKRFALPGAALSSLLAGPCSGAFCWGCVVRGGGL